MRATFDVECSLCGAYINERCFEVVDRQTVYSPTFHYQRVLTAIEPTPKHLEDINEKGRVNRAALP